MIRAVTIPNMPWADSAWVLKPLVHIPHADGLAGLGDDGLGMGEAIAVEGGGDPRIVQDCDLEHLHVTSTFGVRG